MSGTVVDKDSFIHFLNIIAFDRNSWIGLLLLSKYNNLIAKPILNRRIKYEWTIISEEHLRAKRYFHTIFNYNYPTEYYYCYSQHNYKDFEIDCYSYCTKPDNHDHCFCKYQPRLPYIDGRIFADNIPLHIRLNKLIKGRSRLRKNINKYLTIVWTIDNEATSCQTSEQIFNIVKLE